MNRFQQKLIELGIKLPPTTIPGGSYHSVNIRGEIAYVSIQFPIDDGKFKYIGRLGNDLNTSDGIRAAELCAINAISHIDSKIGLENIEGINHIDVFVCCDSNWDDSPLVADGASKLFLNALEEKGYHSRSLVGVASLPRNFCVGVSSSFTLNKRYANTE